MKKFETGDLIISDLVMHAMLVKSGTELKFNEELYRFVQNSFEKFKSGDWGNADETLAELNDEALINGGEILGSYESSNGYMIMIFREVNMKIKNVIFNPPATIVFWADGTKTVVKAHGEEFDPEKGLAMAIAKKALGNGSYYPVIKKWTKEYNGESFIEKLYRDFANSMNRISEIMTDAAEALDDVSLGGEKQ